VHTLNGKAAVRWNLPGWRAILQATRNREQKAVSQQAMLGDAKEQPILSNNSNDEISRSYLRGLETESELIDVARVNKYTMSQYISANEALYLLTF